MHGAMILEQTHLASPNSGGSHNWKLWGTGTSSVSHPSDPTPNEIWGEQSVSLAKTSLSLARFREVRLKYIFEHGLWSF